MMQRREFIAGLGSAAAWPVVARGQLANKVWRVGMLDTATRELNRANMDGFLRGLRELGYVEGRNLVVHYRSADGRSERLPELVAQLIGLDVDVIVTRGTQEVLAAKNATGTIPVVMAAAADPVGLSVAASLSHPGGNITGMTSVASALASKRLGFLKELVPGIKRMVHLGDFSNLAIGVEWEELRTAARSVGIEALNFDIRRAVDVGRAFDVMSMERVEAVSVGGDGTTRSNRQLIIDLAAMKKLPAIYVAREFVDDGGLIAYATNYPDLYRRAATFIDKIFKGVKPADLPIERPTKFELIINLKTAKALGLAIPETLLATADEVIQ
jgi:putative tryptophan/tyrosine transport system substrate-binding protein